MTKSLAATEITVIRPTGTVSPMDHSNGPQDNNDYVDPANHDGTDDGDFPGKG
ncbi:MAG: hypothetical protein ACRDRO_16670 [Pseudonocardiaceae bacterium]